VARDHVVGDGFPERVRIGALTRWFSPELVDFAIEEAGARERAVKLLPARLVVYFTLAMWLFTGVGYGGVLRELVEHWPLRRGEKWRPASTGSLTKARARLGAGVLRVLFDRVRGAQGTPATPGVFWRGLRLTAWDGTTFDAPDSEANAAAFDRPRTKDRPGPYPQVRLLALVECGTRAVIGAVFDSLAVGERTLAYRLLPLVERGTVLLADRGFPSFDLWQAAAARGAELLWRVSTSFALPVDEVLDDGTYLSHLNGPHKARITVRVVEYTVHTTAERTEGTTTESSELFCLISTLLDPAAAPAEELAELYARRWTSETIYRAIKVEQRGGRPATLRSNSPEMVAQELWAMLCVYQAVRHLATDSATENGIPPAQISFKHALHAAQRTVGANFSPSAPDHQDP
jgi:Insertion element 4 transposase N-terminal/Transposase DDE domain